VPLTASPWPGEEDSPWLIDYVAGYVRDGMTSTCALWSTAKGTTSTGRTLPADIEAAVIAKVVSWYEAEEGVIQKSVGDLSVQYDPIGDDPAFKLLRPYIRSA
jgi:hypothetical protein